MQVPASFDGEAGSLEYLIYLPEGYDDTEQPWPLLLFLHGSGERGRDIAKVRGHGPAALVDSGRPLPMIVVSPQCPENTSWQSGLLLELLDTIEHHFCVDSGRFYLTGYSMGGSGIWNLAAEEPDRFAAAVPVCGIGDTHTANRLAKLSIWAFHGMKDSTIPLESSQRMVDAIRTVGGSAKLTVYPNLGHAISKVTYSNPVLYEWLQGQHSSGEMP